MARTPKIAICTYPDVLSVHGTVKAMQLTKGAEVDLNMVVGENGDGSVMTLEDAVGEYIRFFDVSTKAEAKASPLAHTAKRSKYVPPTRERTRRIGGEKVPVDPAVVVPVIDTPDINTQPADDGEKE